MASLPPSLSKTLVYFDKYDYPLTVDELWFWQHNSRFSKLKIEKLIKNFSRSARNSIFKIKNWQLRRQRDKFSQIKWEIARKVGNSLKRFPTIAAVYVTGALAMNNCPANDDIDLMIVTYPNTLWPTRFFVDLYLKITNLRRSPPKRYTLDANYSNKICDNLWLDAKNLKLKTKNLYVAHEILQAKPLWDRAGVHNQFLTQNSWVKKYLPNAYLSLLKLPSPKLGEGPRVRYWGVWPLNLLFFLIQYLYMKPKITSEKVGPGFAFFHPAKISPP